MKHGLGSLTLLAGVVVLAFAMAGRLAAAPAPSLTPTVIPMIGTTATVFVFSTQFHSAGETVTGVSVSVAGSTFPLARDGGPPANQIWKASRSLPAGSWTATFTGTTESGTNPAPVLVGPIVVTTPTPAPVPTPIPTGTPRPTPRPIATPGTVTPVPVTSVTPGASSTPFGTTVGSPSGSASKSGDESARPSGSGSPSPSPAGVPPVSRPFNVPAEGVVAIGLLGAVAVAAAMGERRRRRAVEAFRADQAALGHGPARDADLEAGWERDAVEDETVATIDYEGLDDFDPDA